jgi:hypothetical protein
LPDGRDRVVRHGHEPQRAIQTGVGPVEVRRAKVRDRADVAAEEKIRFASSILPKWARRTKSIDALLPILYLRGVSAGDFTVRQPNGADGDDRQAHGVQARHHGGKNLAAIEGRKPVAESRPRCVRPQNGIEVIEMPAHNAA